MPTSDPTLLHLCDLKPNNKTSCNIEIFSNHSAMDRQHCANKQKIVCVLKPQVGDCYLQNNKPKAAWSVWHESGGCNWASNQSVQHKQVTSHFRCSHFPSKQSQAVKTSEFTACASTLLSKQATNARSEWAVRGGRGWLVSISTPSLPPSTVHFFWSFMCRGSGQLRHSKNILRAWWLFKPFFLAPADKTGTVFVPFKWFVLSHVFVCVCEGSESSLCLCSCHLIKLKMWAEGTHSIAAIGHVLYHKPTITFRIFFWRQISSCANSAGCFKQTSTVVNVGLCFITCTKLSSKRLPCDRRSRYQLYSLDWRHGALQPGRVVVAMLLLFFWWFNAPDTLKGSRSSLCLCNSTA